MDAFRKQLDALMGANRNGDVREVNRKFYDRDVCRLFLVGLCPHDLFQLTKMDLGSCPKVHSLQLRKEYQEAKAKGKDNYDRELEDVIERLISECDRKIQRALKRLEDDDAKAAIAISVSDVTQSPEVVEYTKQIKEKLKEADDLELEGKTDNKIRVMEQVDELRGKRADKQAMLLLEAFNKDRAMMPQPLQNPPPLAPLPLPPDARTQEMIIEKLKKAEELGELGLVDEAQKAMEEAEALKKLGARQDPATDSSKYSSLDVRITDQKLRVCDICGAFLSVYDSDRRLADHFGGKLHLGYMQIREKLVDLKEERMKVRRHDRAEDDGSLKDRASSRDRERASSRDRERERDERDQGRDSVGSRDRERERVRDRDRDRGSRERERGHERDLERSRSYDSRSRRRSRSRSRERLAERLRDRERDRSDRHRRHDRHDRY
uniref:RNA-binding protein Luc7-like 2 n=1 Tax=Araucaria cunninghamii TaxID=56994 RepID=A0A0D6QWV0_ARACU